MIQKQAKKHKRRQNRKRNLRLIEEALNITMQAIDSPNHMKINQVRIMIIVRGAKVVNNPIVKILINPAKAVLKEILKNLKKSKNKILFKKLQFKTKRLKNEKLQK